MKILIIPDVHGRDFWIEPCDHINEFDKIIFLGDYHDPYPNQVSITESRNNFKKLFKFFKRNSDKVITLLGNHDYSYLTGIAPCRYDYDFEDNIVDYLQTMNLKVAYKIDNYLFSHSGILNTWLNNAKLTIDEVCNLDIYSKLLGWISRYRGGNSFVGSCIWGDVREFADYNKPENYYQIFGHTQLHNEIITNEFACLDCRKAFVLDTETKELKEWSK